MLRSLRRATVLALPLLVAVPVVAAASTITITFEGGLYDPNPPATGDHGPYDILEGGARYAGFDFENAGTPSGYAAVGHTHVEWEDRAWSLVDLPHSWRGGMQGAWIRLESGGAFDVVSIDYRIRRRLPWDGADPNSQFARLPWSTPWSEVQLLLSSDPDPSTTDFASFEAEWTAFAIDDGSQFDLGDGTFDPYRSAATTPWRTLQVTGFEDVSQIFIGHTGALVAIDTIVLRPTGGAATPEPASGLLLGLGLGWLGVRRRSSGLARRVG